MTINMFLYCMVSGFVAAISGTICLAKQQKMVGTQNNKVIYTLCQWIYTVYMVIFALCYFRLSSAAYDFALYWIRSDVVVFKER